MIKESEKNSVYNWFVIALTVINAYYCILPHFTGGVFDMDHKFMCVFIGLFFIYYLLTQTTVSKLSCVAMLLIFLSGVFVFVNGIMVFSYFIKWIGFAVSIMLYVIVLSMRSQLKESTWTTIFLSNILIIFICVLESFDPSFYAYSNSGDKLVLTYGNQNTAAMQLLLSGSLFFLFAKKYREENKKARFIISLITVAIVTYLIYLTGSRSTLLGLGFILIFFFMPHLRKILKKRVIVLVLLFPLLFAVLFVALYNAGYREIIVLGRNLFNGRERMWKDVFEGSFLGYLFGSYHEFLVLGAPPFQLHNGIVDMIASYGILITGAFLYIVYKILTKIIKEDTHTSALVVVCILALIVQSVGEAALFTGGRCSYIAMLLLFAFSRTSKEERKEINAEI